MTEPQPSVTVVFLVYNRREELRESLERMLGDSGYPSDLVDVIVVDNASTDGSGGMVREDFPHVQLITRTENIGVSGWNEGLAAARGDFVLALDDDCYLVPGGLGRAVEAAQEYDADLVSFRVVSTEDPGHVFTEKYRTGLFTFWGCAVLMRRRVVEALGGYDPAIFVWANELEFMLRFFDKGFRHLHLPEVEAMHMKSVEFLPWDRRLRPYRINANHFAYIAGKRLRLRDSFEALVALLVATVRDAIREDKVVVRVLPDVVKGFVRGLRHRDPVEKATLSRFYRHNFQSFASPWWISRPIPDIVRGVLRELLTDERRPPGRKTAYYSEREALYHTTEPGLLDFSAPDGQPAARILSSA